VSQRFPYAYDRPYRLVCRLFGGRPARDGVEITDDGRFRARFGPVVLDTPLTNITGAHITEGYRWWTPIGIRRSMKDSGLTFGTNRRAGVCVHFSTPVPTPVGRKGHEALTVTVADLTGLVTALGF
jgi:hypothetical protein